MYFVYVLYSPTHDKIYIGSSNNPQVRLRQHNENSKHGWTKRFRPWVLFHQEEFVTKAEALRREKELKSHQGRLFIRNVLLKKYYKKFSR